MATEIKGLRFLQANPDLLVPERLLSMSANPNNIYATPFDAWIGGYERGFKPPLSVLIVARGGLGDPVLLQECNDVWGRILSNQREAAIKQGLLLYDDFVLASIIAGSPVPHAAFIECLLVSQTLRGQGVGKLILERFASLLPNLDYKCVAEVIFPPKTVKTGYRIEQLKAGNIHRWLSGVPHRSHELGIGVPIVDFLDDALEKECVKPEFLRT